MTAAVQTPTASAPHNRVLTAARLNRVDAGQRFGTPWLILAAIFAVNLAIWWAIRANVPAEAGDDEAVTGGLAPFFFIVASTYLIAMTQVMPFALSMGITRRHFFTGVSLTLAVEALLHAIGLTVLMQVERATGGWGLGMQFFSPNVVEQPNVILQVLIYFVPLLTLGFVFVAFGAVFRRWGQFGIWTTLTVLTLVLGGLVVLFTWQGQWATVGRFFVETPALLLVAGYPLILAAVAAVAGFSVVRRATP